MASRPGDSSWPRPGLSGQEIVNDEDTTVNDRTAPPTPRGLESRRRRWPPILDCAASRHRPGDGAAAARHRGDHAVESPVGTRRIPQARWAAWCASTATRSRAGRRRGRGGLRARRAVPSKAGQLRFARHREAAWTALRSCAVLETVVGSRAWGLADDNLRHRPPRGVRPAVSLDRRAGAVRTIWSARRQRDVLGAGKPSARRCAPIPTRSRSFSRPTSRSAIRSAGGC